MIGIDEVGRGSWAGPLLVVAARECGDLPLGLADSKVISKTKREQFVPVIEASCTVGEGWVTPQEIDQLGLTRAMYLAVDRALEAIEATANEEIIMDGNINYCAEHYKGARAVIDADAMHPIVSAASIYAKVTRDNYMTELAKGLPSYGFEKHVGYGTKLHSGALAKYGVTPHHRLSYKPVKKYL